MGFIIIFNGNFENNFFLKKPPKTCIGNLVSNTFFKVPVNMSVVFTPRCSNLVSKTFFNV